MKPGGDIKDNGAAAAVVWLVLASVIAVLLYLSYYFTHGNKQKKEKKPSAPIASAGQDVNRAGGRRPRRMRVRRAENDDDSDNFNNDDIDEEDMDFDKSEGGKIGKKKMRKLEAKAEKRAERQALLEEREDRAERELVLAAERKKEDERRTQQEQEAEELEKQRKEEQERKEYEEYLKLKAEFTIEESGEIGILSEEESQGLLQEFINYVKTSKVILLEDLAAHFNLKTQEAIDRLENLQEMGRLTGVMDDRGKFIYISEEELNNIAKFIKQRGRISITDLAESSNTLIKLLPDKNVSSNLVEPVS